MSVEHNLNSFSIILCFLFNHAYSLHYQSVLFISQKNVCFKKPNVKFRQQ